MSRTRQPVPDPDAIEALRELGYAPRDYAEALRDAQTALGCGPQAAAMFVGGRADLVETDG